MFGGSGYTYMCWKGMVHVCVWVRSRYVDECWGVPSELGRCLGIWESCMTFSPLTPTSPPLTHRETSVQHPTEDRRRLHCDEGRWVGPRIQLLSWATSALEGLVGGGDMALGGS